MDFEALERLGRLRDSGAITPEEFQSEKRKLLSDETQAAPEEYRVADPPSSSRGAVLPIVVALIALGLIGFTAYYFLAAKGGDEAAVSTTSNGAAAAPTRFAAKSAVSGVRIARLGDVSRNPGGAASDCDDDVISPQTAAGEALQDKGWFVTGEEEVRGSTAVSFAGNLTNEMGSYCTRERGNIGLFSGTKLQALVYGTKKQADMVGGISQISPTTVRIWTNRPNDSLPLADMRVSDAGVFIEKVPAVDRVCHGRSTVPNVFGLDIEKARAKLFRSGWSPIPGEAEQLSGIEGELQTRGVKELEACAGTLFNKCTFRYTSPAGDHLSLITEGEELPVSVVYYETECSGD